MQKYRRVILKDRIQIQSYLILGLNLNQIAKILGFHKSTISREIKRHTLAVYSATDADFSAKAQFKRCRRRFRINELLSSYILDRLKMGWSPEQIGGRLKCEGSSYSLSHQTIYRHFYRNKLNKGKLLRFGYKRRGFGRKFALDMSRNSSWKLPIASRPDEANQRTEIGHWERDLFFGLNRKTVLILADRKTRYTMLKKTNNFKSEEIANITNELLANKPLKTITNDNGSEFFDVKAIGAPVYFCKAWKPQQRGTVENTIGLLRQYLKRKTNLDEVTETTIKALEMRINLRPRKILDYKTPYEVFHNQTVALAM
jgi:IS30 family transposase